MSNDKKPCCWDKTPHCGVVLVSQVLAYSTDRSKSFLISFFNSALPSDLPDRRRNCLILEVSSYFAAAAAENWFTRNFARLNNLHSFARVYACIFVCLYVCQLSFLVSLYLFVYVLLKYKLFLM